MLQITVPATELYDEENEIFINSKEQTLQLEHSLVSISKWESTWNKPFLSKKDKTDEELLDYVKCMTITQNVNPEVYLCLTEDNYKRIKKYIESPMTATTFSEDNKGKNSREIPTSELIYYWMISLNIPMECQKWHLNRLITLIKVCSIKNSPKKKRRSGDIASNQAAINAARRKQLNTKG
jgi:hypothetical protein